MKRIFPIIIASLLINLSARGQTVLTLDQCLSMARDRSPQLRSIQNSLRSASLAYDELQTTALPQLKLVANPILAPATTRFGYDPAVTDGGQISAQLSLQQSLYDAGIRSLQSSQIDFDRERLRKETRRTDRDLTFAVTQAFYETYRAQQQAALLSQSARQLRDYLELVTRLSKGGTASYTDVLKTRVQLANAEIGRQQAQDDYAVSKYVLAELIGAAIDTSFSIEASWNNAAADSLLSLSPDESSRNLDLTIADLTVKRNLLDVTIAERERLPTLSLAADVGYLSSGDNLRTLPPDHYRSIGFSVGLSLELPLINWGATGLRVQQRQLDVENLRLDSELLRRSVDSESKRTRLRMVRLRDRLALMQQNRQSAEENFLLTKSQYAGGGTLSLEVLAAQQLLTETSLAELAARAELQSLIAKLEQLMTR